jgi:hypothetical protein
MSKNNFINFIVWGFTIWLIGYILGIVLFFFVPNNLIGWVIMPIGIAITLWILLKKIQNSSLKYFVAIGLVWTLIAIVCDYFLLVKLLKPIDGYYKLDVYIYYFTTFFLPLIVGWMKILKKQNFQL